jgi:hypothetical protein
MKSDEKLLLLKNETTYKTDAVPTGAANAILAKDVEITPLEVTAIERGLVKPYLGADEEILTGEHVLLTFKVELQGSGAVGTPPALGPVLRSAGFIETITPATSVEYDLADSDYESASIYFYQGTTLHKLIGALANVKPLVEKGIVYLEFSFIGLFEDPTKVTKPVIDWSTWKKPTPTGEGRTSGFLLNGYAAEPLKLTLDVGQEVKFIETLTTAKVDITARKATGNVSILAPELDVHNYFDDAKNSVTGLLTIQQGQTAGLICTISCPKVQVKAPKYGDFEGQATLEMDLILIPTSAGNDEIKFTFT